MLEFRGKQITVGAKMFLVVITGMDTWGVEPITITKITDRMVYLKYDRSK